MAYSREVIAYVKELFEKKREVSERERGARLSRVYSLCPEVRAIDDALRTTTSQIAGAIRLGKDGCAKEIERIKNENLALQKRREDLILSLGLPSDYTSIKHECPICEDTGYTENGTLCKCYKEALRLKSYERSGLARLLEKQSFDSFSLDFYAGDDKHIIKQNFDELLSFASNFETDKRSFLLYGPTGLGKTHLSTAVAKSLLDRGYDVIYETAQNVFFDFENDRFRDRFTDEPPVSTKYLECDLLILDDLGTEMVTSFSVSCLYNIINTRLNKGLPIIASTNLRSDEIRKLYHDRITSRLFGEFIIKQFAGKDIRRQKISK